jgi:hypothetical protein
MSSLTYAKRISTNALGWCLLVPVGLLATAELVGCSKSAQPASGTGGQQAGGSGGGGSGTGGASGTGGTGGVAGSGGSGGAGGAGGSTGTGGVTGTGGGVGGTGGAGTGGAGKGGTGGAGGVGGSGGTAAADASPDVRDAGRGGSGGGGGGTGGSSPGDARNDVVSVSGCDPVHPQNPRAPLFACPAGAGCISAASGASQCSSAGTGTEGTSCSSASDCAPGYYCPNATGASCRRFCIDDQDCPGGTCAHSFGTDQYAGPYEVGSCRPCATGLVGCNSSCLEVDRDPSNCGSCGHACSDGQTCCGGTCVAQASLGACGCGGTATDSDGDGVPDCNDVCPSNAAASQAGKVTYSVIYTDAAQAHSQHFAEIERCVDYAGKEWSKHFPVPHDVSIEVLVDVADLSASNALARCRSTSTVFLRAQDDGKNVYQMGVVNEILTGFDPNGSKQDIELTFDAGYLEGTGIGGSFWLDPDPDKRAVPLPNHMADGLSVCMHEFGHALGISGWRDTTTGLVTGTTESDFDLASTTDGSNFFFAGPSAVSVYGGPVPETYGNFNHLANLAPRPGTDLADDLMHGIPTFTRARYYIRAVDVALMKDIGLPVPGSDAIKEVCDSAGTLASRIGGINQSRAIVLGPTPPFVE